jgi:hypothetical protein
LKRQFKIPFLTTLFAKLVVCKSLQLDDFGLPFSALFEQFRHLSCHIASHACRIEQKNLFTVDAPEILLDDLQRPEM